MSDASEVKRPRIFHVNKDAYGSYQRAILVEDHDRIVTELKAEVARQAREIEVLTEKVSFMSLDSLRKYAVVKAMKDNSNDLDKAAESLKVSRKRLTVELLAYNLYPATLEKEGVKDDANN